MVFTKVLKSKVLLQRNCTRFVLLQHNRVVRFLIKSFQGYECQEESGGFMIAFRDAGNAARFAAVAAGTFSISGWWEKLKDITHISSEYAQALSSTPLSVTIGLHSGQPSSVAPHGATGRADYFGSLVNVAARVRAKAEDLSVSRKAAGEGGSVIFASRATVEFLARDAVGLFTVETQSSYQEKLEASPPTEQATSAHFEDCSFVEEGRMEERVEEPCHRRLSRGKKVRISIPGRSVSASSVELTKQETDQTRRTSEPGQRTGDLSEPPSSPEEMRGKRKVSDFSWGKGRKSLMVPPPEFKTDIGTIKLFTVCKLKGVTGLSELYEISPSSNLYEESNFLNREFTAREYNLL